MNNKTQKLLVSIFATFLGIVFLCFARIASAESNSFTVLSGFDERKTDAQPDSSLVNRWYYEGCLTGCANGYLIGYCIGQDEGRDARRQQRSAQSGAVADWPQGKMTREIQTVLDEILSNEARLEEVVIQHPLPQPRLISTPQQLPIRHAGIYSTFHAAVHDGFRDGYVTDKASYIDETNKYLKLYAESHKTSLPDGIAKEILRVHMVEMLD